MERGWGTEEQPVAVVAAGERWPGRDALRPAIEDWLGAAAVIAALLDRGAGPLSAEAAGAAAGYDGIADVRDVVPGCASARELVAMGFGEDVDVAIELGTSRVVPVLIDEYFAAAS